MLTAGSIAADGCHPLLVQQIQVALSQGRLVWVRREPRFQFPPNRFQQACSRPGHDSCGGPSGSVLSGLVSFSRLLSPSSNAASAASMSSLVSVWVPQRSA